MENASRLVRSAVDGKRIMIGTSELTRAL
jgi:hypothetical protein